MKDSYKFCQIHHCTIFHSKNQNLSSKFPHHSALTSPKTSLFQLQNWVIAKKGSNNIHIMFIQIYFCKRLVSIRCVYLITKKNGITRNKNLIFFAFIEKRRENLFISNFSYLDGTQYCRDRKLREYF